MSAWANLPEPCKLAIVAIIEAAESLRPEELRVADPWCAIRRPACSAKEIESFLREGSAPWGVEGAK